MLALLAAFAPLARPASAAAFVVTSFLDSGAGTLRQAIIDANASAGADTITFSAAGTINLNSPLPALTGGSITIDGTVPAGGTVPKVEIRGQGLTATRGAGIMIRSSGNTVRGLILNGFTKEALVLTAPDWGGAGVVITGSATGGVAANNVVEYNYIGTNAAGNALGQTPQNVNNEVAGVLMVSGASDNTIRNNVIAGNNGPGIYLTRDRFNTETFAKSGNIIRDNLIGLTADGSAALPNTHGIWVGNNSQNTVIGPGNTISGNGDGHGSSPGIQPFYYGVFIQYDVSTTLSAGVFFPSGTVVKGNKIGTDPAGSAALPNKDGGVLVGLSTNTTIGGANAADPNERNLISGNRNIASFGVSIEDYANAADAVQRTVGAVVQNNWIGLDASGTAALPNRLAGVLLRNHIRGARVGPGNVISGNGNPATSNGGAGVLIQVTSGDVTNSRQANSNEISGNLIGTGPDGNGGFAFQDTGISLLGDTTANVIKNNRITSNQVSGVDLEPNSGTNGPSGNTIQDNVIGASADGSAGGNGTLGIQLLGAGNTVGPGNDIAGHSAANGVGLSIATSGNIVKGNTVRANRIGIEISNGATGNLIGGTAAGDGNNLINNALYGVYVNGAGTTGNHISQTTTNSNGDKGIKLENGGNGPIAGATISVTPPASGFTLTGSASGCAGGCTIEIFTTDDNTQLDEGPNFLPTASLTGINGPFSVDISGCHQYLTFTLTDNAGNTSEFLSPTGRIAQCVPATPIVTLSDATPAQSQGALPGTNAIFRHTVTNTGTGPGALSVTKSSASNWTSALDTSACPPSLTPGGSCEIILTVSVPSGATPGEINDTTITASLAGAAASAQKTDRTTALSAPALTFVPETPGANNQTVGSGQPVTYRHLLTNTGNGPDSFDISVAPPAGWTYSIQPASPIALAQNASTIVTVVLTPTAGIAAGSYPATVTATSRSLASVTADVIDTTTITPAAVPQIASVVTPATADPGVQVTIAYTITNVGNQDGTFDLSFTPPSGWTVSQAAPASVAVPFAGPPASFSVILLVPASALADSYPATLTATANSAPNAAATKIDRIAVNQKAELTLAPNIDDPTLRAPGTVITYTSQLLTNGGNFTDTISLAATASRAGWSARVVSPSVTLSPGASTPIAVAVTIPLGQLAGISNTTTITASSSVPAVAATALITTTIADISGALFTPVSQEKVIDAGKPITYTFTLVNSGSVDQSYTLTQAGAPGGWTSTLTPTTTPTLAPGASQAVTLVLQPPAGTPDGTPASVTITAACVEKPCADATATAKLTVGPPFSVGVGGICDGPALPGAVLTCVHTIVNTGFSADTYLVSTLSPLGWSTAVAPALLFLAPGASGTVTITLTVPSSADAGLQHLLTVRARSTALPSIFQTLTDTTTILQLAGISFSPNRVAPTIGGQLLQFQHTLLNTGNGLDSYVITATQNLNWSITIVPTTTSALPRGTYQTIQVSVQVPSGATTVVTNRITLRARSTFAPSLSEEVVDMVGVVGAEGTRYLNTYLPVQMR
jgi:parallel beta-helix repeat protein